jgi:hypothetical protein
MDHAVETIVQIARSSPYYEELHRNIPPGTTLEGLPFTDHQLYWASYNTDPRLVMTGRQIDGVVMKTGGKTNAKIAMPLHPS